ncbi:MAG: hypothetical protein AAGC63_00315 [Propionicimonas sp.]|nr:hypothetical protein [Propionicimonas sp.]
MGFLAGQMPTEIDYAAILALQTQANAGQIGDTSWTSLTTSGISGTVTCRWRKRNGRIEYELNVTGTSLAADAALTAYATIPAGNRPGSPIALSAVAGGSRDMAAWVSTSGALGLRNLHTATVTDYFVSGSWIPV